MLVILDVLSGALPFVIRSLASSTSGVETDVDNRDCLFILRCPHEEVSNAAAA